MSAGRRRRQRYGGRYTYIFSEFWRDRDVKTLSCEARHLLLCLMTGSLANQAGLFPLHVEAILADFETRGERLSRDDLEALLGELEKRPHPSRSFIVRDLDVLWIRSQLRNDPVRVSENTRKGIRWDLGRVPKTSRVVKQYRKYYADILAEGAHSGAAQAPGRAHEEVPDTPSPSGEEREKPLPETERGERERREPHAPAPIGDPASPKFSLSPDRSERPRTNQEFQSHRLERFTVEDQDALTDQLMDRDPTLSRTEAGVQALKFLAQGLKGPAPKTS